jgi:hypothetical protein
MDGDAFGDRENRLRRSESRIIGSVFFSPSCPMENDSPLTWEHAWALIQLKEEAFENQTQDLQNRVYVGNMGEHFSKPLNLVNHEYRLSLVFDPSSPNSPNLSLFTAT